MTSDGLALRAVCLPRRGWGQHDSSVSAKWDTQATDPFNELCYCYVCCLPCLRLHVHLLLFGWMFSSSFGGLRVQEKVAPHRFRVSICARSRSALASMRVCSTSS